MPQRPALSTLAKRHSRGGASEVDADGFSRWFLAIYFVAVGIFYTGCILIKTRRRGASPVNFGRRGSRHWLIHGTFRVFRVVILLVCLARVFYPSIDAWLVPFRPLWVAPVLISGDILMVTSFAGLIWLHSVMGAHWRSGVPADDAVPLITTGPFARTRNPMFLLIQLAQLGFFLSLPSLFTLTCLAVGVAAIQVQTRIEEHHLEARHGEAYFRYRDRVPRWLVVRPTRQPQRR